MIVNIEPMNEPSVAIIYIDLGAIAWKEQSMTVLCKRTVDNEETYLIKYVEMRDIHNKPMAFSYGVARKCLPTDKEVYEYKCNQHSPVIGDRDKEIFSAVSGFPIEYFN